MPPNSLTKRHLFAFILSIVVMALILYSLPPLTSVSGGDKFVWRPSKVEHFVIDKEIMIAYSKIHALHRGS